MPALSHALARASSLAYSAGRSGPNAIRAAPVSVAKSSNSVGFNSHARVSASHSTSRPSASVLSISTLTRLRVVMMSPGRNAFGPTAFSTAAISKVMRSGSLRAITSSASASACAAPPMSFFMLRMPAAAFRSSPPVSKQTPLPHSTICGCAASPQLSSIRRGARCEARPTA